MKIILSNGRLKFFEHQFFYTRAVTVLREGRCGRVQRKVAGCILLTGRLEIHRCMPLICMELIKRYQIAIVRYKGSVRSILPGTPNGTTGYYRSNFPETKSPHMKLNETNS